MSNKIFEKLTNQMQETIESGLSLALHNKNQEVEIIHILWGLLTNTSWQQSLCYSTRFAQSNFKKV